MDFFEKFFCKLPKLQFLRISRAMKFHETPTSIAIYVVSGFTFNASLFFFTGQIYKSGRVCACAKWENFEYIVHSNLEEKKVLRRICISYKKYR